MISHEHRVIFIHVPKTAGTSIEAALGHLGPAGLVRGVQDHRSLRQLQWPHGGVSQLRSWDNCREAGRAVRDHRRRHEHAANRLTVTRAQYTDYFKFSVVRNPWARAYSWFRNVRADPMHRARLDVAEDTSFVDFLARHAGVGPLRPQTYWLLDFRGRIGVDLVCRYENLRRDYAEVCRNAGLPDLPLPRLNPSQDRTADDDYVSAYDDVTRRLVAQRYRDEIARFAYTFEPAPG